MRTELTTHRRRIPTDDIAYSVVVYESKFSGDRREHATFYFESADGDSDAWVIRSDVEDGREHRRGELLREATEVLLRETNLDTVKDANGETVGELRLTDA